MQQISRPAGVAGLFFDAQGLVRADRFAILTRVSPSARTLAVGLSDVGTVRQNNEDVLVLDADAGFFVVCDGVGGHQAGEVAARIAADTVSSLMRAGLGEVRLIDTDERAPRMIRLAEEAVAAAARSVWTASHEDPEHFGMATTLLLLAVEGSTAVMGHVGDSRLYLWRKGEVSQLTIDHTFVNELVIAGALEPSTAKRSPHRNVLTRCLGMTSDTVAVDVLAFDVFDGDRLLLCTDGLSDVLESPRDLDAYLAHEDFESIPQRLVELAKRRGSNDNITVAVVGVRSAPRTERTQRRERHMGALAKTAVCSDLTLRDRMKLLRIGRVVTVEAGRTFCGAGELIPGLCILLEGAIIAAAPGETVRQLGPGAHFGIAALTEPYPAPKRYDAMRNSFVLVVDAASLASIESARPQLAVKFLANVTRELRRALIP